MKKIKLYGKTARAGNNDKVVITEKLDGSNLCILKKDGVVYYAQRNNILTKESVTQEMAYQGLVGWIEEHDDYFNNNLIEGSVICGEWLYMGKLKYPEEQFPNRFNMFCKATVTNQWTLENMVYDHDLFIYPFEDQTIPEFISLVPIVTETRQLMTITQLDELYYEYSKLVDRNVEGFVLNYKNNITKYVRMKSGKITEHRLPRDEEVDYGVELEG